MVEFKIETEYIIAIIDCSNIQYHTTVGKNQLYRERSVTNIRRTPEYVTWYKNYVTGPIDDDFLFRRSDTR